MLHPHVRAPATVRWLDAAREAAPERPSWRPAPHNPLLHLPQAIWLLRSDGEVLLSSAAARALRLTSPAADGERLLCMGSLGEAQMSALFRLAVAGTPAQAALWLDAPLRTGRLQVQALNAALRLAWAAPADALLVCLQLDDAVAQQQSRLDAVCTRCRLTPTERCVLLLLADGLSPEQTAAQLGMRLSTLRCHVRHMLAKTQTRSLLQLLRWVGSRGDSPAD